MLNDRLRILCRRDNNNSRYSFFPASCRARRFRTQHAARCCEIFENTLAQTPGMMNVNELLAILMTGDRVENLLLSLCAKAFDVANLPGLARRAQLFDTGNPKFFLKT